MSAATIPPAPLTENRKGWVERLVNGNGTTGLRTLMWALGIANVVWMAIIGIQNVQINQINASLTTVREDLSAIRERASFIHTHSDDGDYVPLGDRSARNNRRGGG